MITFLKWDSRFFRKKIIRIAIGKTDTKEKLDQMIQIFYRKNYDCAYLILPKERKDLLKYCKEKKFFLSDKKLLMRKHTNSFVMENYIHMEENYSLKERDFLINLIHQLAEKSRFYKDPNFRPYAYSLYEKWLFRSMKNSDYKYFFTRMNNKPVGFIALKLKSNNCYIDLFIVDENYRKKGIGRALLETADTWAKNKGYDTMFVVTQADNEVAVKVYKKYGFKREKIDYVFHIWRK